MLLHIGGDGSHLALVDAARYRSFLGENWYLSDALYKHLIAEGGERAILAWRTGFESDWRVEVSKGHSGRKGFREFTGEITNSDGALYLVNYDSLTMAAQFEDHVLPDRETALYRVPCPVGDLRIRVVQMFDPKSKWWEYLGESAAFVIEYETLPPCTSGNTRSVWWWNDL